eukprot:COSAG03_NODE_1029_length_4991_cov_62.803557_2_plen_46_part_00
MYGVVRFSFASLAVCNASQPSLDLRTKLAFQKHLPHKIGVIAALF